MNDSSSKPETTLAPPALALLKRITGTPLEAERLQTLLADCSPILEEIARLRTVYLGDLHPAVIYEPSAAKPAARKSLGTYKSASACSTVGCRASSTLPRTHWPRLDHPTAGANAMAHGYWKASRLL